VAKPGTVCDDLVLSIDISATILKIAGVEPPANMGGQVFLGPGARPPRERRQTPHERTRRHHRPLPRPAHAPMSNALHCFSEYAGLRFRCLPIL
jgi:arylsulfatase A-like enzyme